MLLRISKFRRAFTIVELAIAGACVSIAGGAVFVLLQSATNLIISGHSANRSNQLAWLTMDRLTRDVHSSIEIPTLLNGSGAPVALAGATPVSSAGIKFRSYTGGPFRIPADTDATATTVSLVLQPGTAMPRPGRRICSPSICKRASSTPATALTSIRRKACWTFFRSASGAGGSPV